ncbi:hypothetical protein [Rhodobacter ferrooxidans]|uniref:Uncharacterized protein n=1 Tax=Rhodobacter ferrooxidans TaxID=371731 RepID=C8RXW4_9RHOB|nr:hypothetical protein [Rhodobacter sp. SW2]EEW26362.1 conserved hypothetical protein [Rhodobacter sp. SW2]
MTETAAPTRPHLTLPDAEAAAVLEAYAGAECILEYGSGGSTVLAGDMPGKTVYSVESDAGWLAMMQGWFAANPPKSRVFLHHADIGPTKEWGHPVDEAQFRRWPGYALSVWDRPDFRHPDTVLIDGRFRMACLLTAAFRITRPLVALVDDYIDRKPYHGVERFLKPAAMIGRMARFELVPTAFPVDRMAWVLNFYHRPA